MQKLTYLSTVILLAVITSQAAGETLKVDFNGSQSNGSATIEQTQDGYQAYNASNELDSSFGSRTYLAFGAAVSVTPTWASGSVAAAKQAWNRGNSYGYSTLAADMLDLVTDWIGTDQRSVGDPMTLTISGLPTGTYSWKSYHHDTQNQTGHFSVTVNDAAGSAITTGIQVSSSQSLSDITLADVTIFETPIISDGINPVTLVFDATDTPDYYTMFVINGFEISNGSSTVPDSNLRRPISPEQPMWLIHIDTWNWADPQKIIDMVPADIRPYVVFNISLSINHDSTTGKWLTVEYGYETAKSWLRACAENQVWAMIQPSSGGFCHFSDFDLGVYEEFFRDYPNFLGFNYAEQFWGFDDPWSVTYPQRLAHWANLMKLCDKYGGYLVVSFTGGFWGASLNPVAMMKRDANFAAICKQSPDNFILCEKYTMGYGFHDIESTCLGTYLSGFSGNYGIRFDECGWIPYADEDFPVAAGAAPVIEHIMLTGETVIDGPETIPQQSSREIGTGTTSDGYTTRRWEFYPQFYNISMDIFRKILDGTIRILSRKEVIDRTRVVIVNDVNTGDDRAKYSSPETLFSDLYLMDGDGTYMSQKSWFKKTGRYPAIPTVYQLADSPANSFQVKVNRSAYSTRWPTTTAKVSEFNTLFPQEYTGDIYAGRHENGWVTYNPYKSGQTAGGSIPFKYNTCDHLELTYSQYTVGIIKEYADRLTCYLTNYDNANTSLKTDVIKIYGSTLQPTCSYVDRASHQASTVTTAWANGVFTITVTHNGPLDITVTCAGSASGRLTSYKTAAVAAPVKPGVYKGPRQYEAENFDYKNTTNVANGVNRGISNYTGQGYMRFGTNSAASVRDTVKVLKTGTYRLETKYAVTEASVNTVDLYVNGTKVATPVFAQTATLSDWAINKQIISLNAGTNTIEFRAKAAGAGTLYFDNMVVVPTAYGYGITIQENKTGFYSVDGTVDNTYSGFTGDGYANTNDVVDAGIHWKVFFDASVTKSFTFRYAGTENRTAKLIVNGVTIVSGIQFPSTGSLTAWDYVTVYTNTVSGTSDVRLQSTSNTGLPNVDYMEVTGMLPQIPVAPTGLTAITVSSSRIDLMWNAASDATSYTIKRMAGGGSSFVPIASSAETTYSDTGLSELTTYYYVVSAVNTAGESPDSAQAGAKTLSGPPAVPSGLAATMVNGSVHLAWNANSESDLAGYNVYRSTTSSGVYTILNGSLLSSPEFTDSSVSYYIRYDYVVKAVDTYGEESDFSEAVSIMPIDGLSTPLSTADFESGLGDWVNITGEDSHNWTRNSGETGTSETGPNCGAGGSSWYVYLETSPGGAANSGNNAILESPVINGYKRVLMFDYHMCGQEIGTLNVDVYDGTWHPAVWHLSGPQQLSENDDYTQAIVDLNNYNGPIRIRLRAEAVGGPHGDIAVDTIQVIGRLFYGDMNADSTVDAEDLSEFADYWLQKDCSLDLDGDCVITLYELSEFSGNWLKK